jgi:hypothetical protein
MTLKIGDRELPRPLRNLLEDLIREFAHVTFICPRCGKQTRFCK